MPTYGSGNAKNKKHEPAHRGKAGHKGAHRPGVYRCSAPKCPGHKSKDGFCTLV